MQQDKRDLVFLFQNICLTAAEQENGFPVRLDENCYFIYFGYPYFYADYTLRAANAGLQIVALLDALGKKILNQYGITLKGQISICTGLTDESPPTEENLVVRLATRGTTESIASELQKYAVNAAPVITSTIWRQIRLHYPSTSLGMVQLDNFDYPVEIFTINHNPIQMPNAFDFSMDVPEHTRQTAHKDDTVSILSKLWQESMDGKGRVVWIRGDDGSDKSDLVLRFITSLPGSSFSMFDFFFAEEGQKTPYYPVIERLQRIYGLHESTHYKERHRILQAIFAELGPLSEKDLLCFDQLLVPTQDLPFDPDEVKQRQKSAMLRFVTGMVQRQPMLLWAKNAHWADPESRELMNLLITLSPDLPLYFIITSSDHPSLRFLANASIEKIKLNTAKKQKTADRKQEKTASKKVPASKIEQAEKNTLKDQVLRRNTTNEPPGLMPIIAESIEKRLQGLGKDLSVLQMAAVQGFLFQQDVLAAACEEKEKNIEKILEKLCSHRLIVKLPNTSKNYSFRHNLIRESILATLSPMEKKTYYSRIARVMETFFPEKVQENPSAMAEYYKEAGQLELSYSYQMQAGCVASSASSHIRACRHFEKAFEALCQLSPGSERDEKELELQAARIGPTIAAYGYGTRELKDIISRAEKLLNDFPGSPHILPLLYSRWAYELVTGNTRESLAVAERLYQVGKTSKNTHAKILAYRLRGTSLGLTGNPRLGEQDLLKALALYDPAKHHELTRLTGVELRVGCYNLLAFCRWLQGDGEEAANHYKQAIKISDAIKHSNTRAFALTHLIVLAVAKRDFDLAIEIARELHGFAVLEKLPFWIAHAGAFQGWINVRLRPPEETIPLLKKGLLFFKQINMRYLRSTHLRWMAEAYTQAKNYSRAAECMHEAIELIEKSGESWAAADHFVFLGHLQKRQHPNNLEKAIASYEKAITTAKKQGAMSLELRARLALARLPQPQEEKNHAIRVLQQLVDTFPYPEQNEDFRAAVLFLEKDT